jgi:AcrR family transcriptional regulator
VRQKEETRRLILQAAYAMLVEVGYEKTTFRAVASRAGVGLGTIFKHFPDKPSLVVAAFRDDLGAVVGQALATLPQGGLLAQFSHLTARIYTFYATNALFSRALVKAGLFLEGAHGEALQEQLQAFLLIVERLIAAAIRTGELPSATDVGLGAQAYAAFYWGGLVTGLSQPTFDVARQTGVVHALCATYFLGPGQT